MWCEKNNLEDDELKKLYHGCIRNNCFALGADYTFSICGRSNIGRDLGYIDTTKEDNVDILHNDIATIRKKTADLLKKDYLESCRYCQGGYKIVPAGEQRR